MFDARRSTMTIQHWPHQRHLVLVVGDVCNTGDATLTATLLDAGFVRKPAARDRLIEIIERHCPRRDTAAVA